MVFYSACWLLHPKCPFLCGFKAPGITKPRCSFQPKTTGKTTQLWATPCFFLGGKRKCVFFSMGSMGSWGACIVKVFEVWSQQERLLREIGREAIYIPRRTGVAMLTRLYSSKRKDSPGFA